MTLIRRALRIARLDAQLLRAFPRLWLSVAGIVLIPALYAFIYLESVWDPASRTGLLQAAIVNLDKGSEIGGKPVNIGGDLVRTLQARRIFNFREDADPAHARQEVRAGRTLFALIIPPDFSATALNAATPGASKVLVFVSEGNNYAGAGFARRFANELAFQVNGTLSERRWEVVLGQASESADSLARMREVVAKLHLGAVTLDSGLQRTHDAGSQVAGGAQRLSDQVGTMADGVQQLGKALRAMDARKPPQGELQSLKTGANQIAEGQVGMARSYRDLELGARQLAQGARTLRDELRAAPFVGDAAADGANRLAEGGWQLGAGLRTARDAQQRLATSTQTVAEGTGQAVDALGTYASGVSTLTARLPQDAQLDALTSGSRQIAEGSRELFSGLSSLKSGSSQLAVGVTALQTALPNSLPALAGTSKGLAQPVEPQFEIDAPVGSNGMGFLPNFIPVALWLGAALVPFVFPLRRVPQTFAGESPAALLIGKLAVLVPINLIQVLCVFVMCAVVLGLHPAHAAGLVLTMAVSAITFTLLIVLLLTALGDLGKALALVLVILQLSSAGGVVPIELTNDFYAAISPWMPFTWAIRAVRATAFDAFGGDWASSLGVLAIFGLVAFALALKTARWHFVPDNEHRPAVEI